MKIGVVIVAGGKGLRAGGDVPKQLQRLGARRVFEWSVNACLSHPNIDQTVLVVPAGQSRDYYQTPPNGVQMVAGGDTRTASVLCGLKALQFGDDDIVLIHDAARPGLGHDIISRLIEAMSTADASAPARKILDAVKRKSGTQLESVNRDNLYRVQTPQAFRYGRILSLLSNTDHNYIDDLAALEANGANVRLVDGTPQLAKITEPGDFRTMTHLLAPVSSIPRIGFGYDMHRLEPGENVILCGISIPHSHSLAGHSDADVAWHALTDAILGAAALGDIGDHFPPTDPQWQGADSAVFLRHAIKLAREAGYTLQSCDLTLICEAPKIKPHREQMRQRTAEATNLSLNNVSIKATTTEKLGPTGRREGIAAQAVAVLSATEHTA